MSERPTDVQVRVASALAVDISGDTQAVAAARLGDAVADAIGERYGPGPATARQREFSATINLDVSEDTLRVASARIADELSRRNREALITLGLRPGDRVVVRKTYQIDDRSHEWVREFTISSIDAAGRLHFKGGNGAGAWPTEVEKPTAPAAELNGEH